MHPCMIYFINIYHKSQANVSTNTIHGSYEVTRQDLCGICFQNCHADRVPFRVALMEKPLPEYSNAQQSSMGEGPADRSSFAADRRMLRIGWSWVRSTACLQRLPLAWPRSKKPWSWSWTTTSLRKGQKHHGTMAPERSRYLWLPLDPKTKKHEGFKPTIYRL